MKTCYLLPALAVLAACSAPESEAPADSAPLVEASTPAGPYSEDNLAFSDACFNEGARVENLELGQTLIERGPAGVVLVAYNQADGSGVHSFDVTAVNDEIRQRVDNAAADFFRNAGVAYDVTTDNVIYHRQMDGTFCAVVNVPKIANALASEARAIQADIDSAAAPTE